MPEECVFCGVLAGASPASFVHRDENCAAFMDIQSINPGHVLIVPNEHASCLSDIDEDTGTHLFRIGQRAAAALYESGVKCEGVNFFLADGEAAGQKVFHAHLHVFPRFAGDGFGLRFGPGYMELPKRPELDEVASGIGEFL